ncbi:PhnD/SsuA/transferrin family substrate-binding protein [Rhizobium sp. KVB221]|uniref:PhnD/SsuA/transferrin family substrate-binding protein n=1 Tax=Rhizobium setariae TaxID=2801340 RepID=A0A936YSD9_9HYPH|nr:PhnD/SsuA/transferrin family substrate-binding protein [Rhizobium setariae]MBL0371787.1 PhnD/SsuA/transferrin family substrate-binding protein [Rhizobium setariae]
MSRASLAMYDMLEPVRAANDQLWVGVRERLRAAGVDAPDALDRQISHDGIWLQPDLVLAQTCGYPYIKMLTGKVRLVATPVYDFAGGAGTERTSFLIASETNTGKNLESFRGSVAAVNDHMSNSGSNLFRAALAPLAGGKPFFSSVKITGGHLPSIAAVAAGEADIASIDTVSWGMLDRHAPDMLKGVRIIGETPSGPGLPFITRLSASDAEVDALRNALKDAIADPALADATKALGLRGVEVLSEDDYRRLDRLGIEAAALNYPIIA